MDNYPFQPEIYKRHYDAESHPIDCPCCKGLGVVPYVRLILCKACLSFQNDFNNFGEWPVCSCHRVIEKELICPKCAGAGFVYPNSEKGGSREI